jgi:asparagine synthase (glutamine-hydrolysing)
VQNAPGVDDIEGTVFERKSLGVRDGHVTMQTLELEPAPDQLDGALGEVDPGHIRAGSREADEVGTETDADLQHVATTGSSEISEFRDERLEPLARFLNLPEELRRTLGRAGVLGTARPSLPVVANDVFAGAAHRRSVAEVSSRPVCGIVGVFGRHGAEIDPARVVAMRDSMTHRGPDDEGLWTRDGRANVVLGHRRLAIVDLSPAGRAPMTNEDGSVVVTFNGEIYNHATLRRDLETRGHRFRSRCDTEVLVHLYEEHGEAMVDRLIGMFAFAIWDEAHERLLLARDRLGIKPLYWLDDGERFAFASETKALVPLLQRREIDPVALAQYLSFVAVPPPRTLFEGISKLPPASTMLVDRDGARPSRRYWDALERRAEFDASSQEWEQAVLDRLRRSVDRRMMSDVPVGVFLSGGVDSSTNVALMSELTARPVNTFSIAFEGTPEYDELSWARQVSNRFGTRHHELRIDHEDLWRFLPELVFHQDEPIADPVCVPLYFVAKLAKESGVTVVHVGEGADEIFAGYPTYVRAHRMASRYWPRLRSLPQPLRAGLAAAGDAALAVQPRREIHVEALARAAEPDGELWWGGAVAFYERGLARLTTDAFRARLDGQSPSEIVHAIGRDAETLGARDELDRIIYQDLRLRLPELLLMRVDKLTMATAVEARVPFLDHELVELAMAVPTSEKIRDGVGKHILKRAVSDLLPADVVWRPKQGFGAPVSSWFRGPLGEQLERQLMGSPLGELGWFRSERIRRLLDLHRSGRADRSFQLWNLLNLSTWFDHWIAGREPVAA